MLISGAMQEADIQCVVLSTMPRSGTWYSLFLWEHLDMLLTGREEYLPASHVHPRVFRSLGVAQMHLHCTFPNFAELAAWSAVTRYEALEFHTPGYNAASDLGQPFTFKGNPDLRVLYVCRNPLDQIVSIYDHSVHHVDRSVLTPPAKYGSSRPYESASDLALRGGAESYLKQYLTFRYFADLGFPQLMVVAYEHLKRNPVHAFDQMLQFCGAGLHPQARDFLVSKAVELSSTENVARMEQRKGGAISGDQIGDQQTHLRGGEVGKWKSRLSAEAVEHVWGLFAQHGVAASDFALE